MFGHSVFVCGRFLTLLGFALIKTCRIQNCSLLFRQGRAQSYQPPETATETSMIWCRSAGISMRVWDQPSEKSTFFCSERIWDILQSSCINIPPDKGIELILTRFTKKIGNSGTFSGKTWQNEGKKWNILILGKTWRANSVAHVCHIPKMHKKKILG